MTDTTDSVAAADETIAGLLAELDKARVAAKGTIEALVAERDAYKADAERLAEALRDIQRIVNGRTAEYAEYVYGITQAALAAHDARQQEQSDAD